MPPSSERVPASGSTPGDLRRIRHNSAAKSIRPGWTHPPRLPWPGAERGIEAVARPGRELQPAREAPRVLEDYCRFVLDDRVLTGEVKASAARISGGLESRPAIMAPGGARHAGGRRDRRDRGRRVRSQHPLRGRGRQSQTAARITAKPGGIREAFRPRSRAGARIAALSGVHAGSAHRPAGRAGGSGSGRPDSTCS